MHYLLLHYLRMGRITHKEAEVAEILVGMYLLTEEVKSGSGSTVFTAKSTSWEQTGVETSFLAEYKRERYARLLKQNQPGYEDSRT